MTTSSADERQTDWSVLPVALAFGFGMGAAGWWLTKEEPVETPGAVMTRVEGVQPPAAGRLASSSSVPASPRSSVPASPRPPVSLAPAAISSSGVSGAVAGVAPTGAERLLDAEFGLPLVSPVKERPPFMNANEWSVLTASARQMDQPDEDTTALVNHLRFRRLVKRWREAAPGLPGGAHVRAQAAQMLLDDLRPRLLSGHVSLAEARQWLPDLLADAVANPAERTQRAQALANELNQAAQTRAASSGAPPSSDPAP